MLSEGAHTNLPIWCTNVLPLSSTHFMVFDIDSNVMLFHRVALPINEQEKFILRLVGSYRLGESVSKAIFGSLSV